MPNPGPALDKILAPIGTDMLSSAEAGVSSKAAGSFPNSNSVLDEFQSAI